MNDPRIQTAKDLLPEVLDEIVALHQAGYTYREAKVVQKSPTWRNIVSTFIASIRAEMYHRIRHVALHGTGRSSLQACQIILDMLTDADEPPPEQPTIPWIKDAGTQKETA